MWLSRIVPMRRPYTVFSGQWRGARWFFGWSREEHQGVHGWFQSQSKVNVVWTTVLVLLGAGNLTKTRNMVVESLMMQRQKNNALPSRIWCQLFPIDFLCRLVVCQEKARSKRIWCDWTFHVCQAKSKWSQGSVSGRRRCNCSLNFYLSVVYLFFRL